MNFDARVEHECACDCHHGRQVAHVRPCCEPCTLCGTNVRHGQMSLHIAAVHSDMMGDQPELFDGISHVDTDVSLVV